MRTDTSTWRVSFCDLPWDSLIIDHFNSLTAIRVSTGTKTPAHRIPIVGIVEKPFHLNTTIPQTSPPWWSLLPLPWSRFDGSPLGV